MRQVVILAAGAGSRISPWRKRLPKPLIPLCGVPLLERAVLTAKRAGFREFVVVTGHEAERVEAHLGDGSRWGVSVRYVRNPEWGKSNGVSVLQARGAVSGEFVLLMSDHVVDVSTLKRMAALSLAQDELVLVTDPRLGSIYDLRDATKVRVSGDRLLSIGKSLREFDAIDAGVFLCSTRLFDVLERRYREKGDASLSEGVAELAEEGKARVAGIGSGWWQDVDTRGAYRHAERLLLEAQRRPTDPVVARLFNRPVSLFISKYLSRTSMRPDVASLLSIAAVMISSGYLIQGDYLGLMGGALFYWFSSIFSGCDGEIARLKFLESKRSEWIDSITHALLLVLFAVSLTVGLYGRTGSPVVLGMGFLAVAGLSVLFAIVFQHLARVARSGSLLEFAKDYGESVDPFRDFPSHLAVLLRPLVRRATFSFMFFVMALLNMAGAVLFLLAVGVNVAWVLVLLTFRREPRVLGAHAPRSYYR